MTIKLQYLLFFSLFIFHISFVKADWVQVNNGLPVNEQVNTLCSYTNNGVNYIFAGTYWGEIFLSTNDGNSWTLNYQTINQGSIYQFALTNVGGINYIYAGTLGYIFRSTNNGVNWIQLPFPNGTHWYYSIAANNNYVFTGLKWWSNDSGGVYKSTNYGMNWVRTSIPIQQYCTGSAENGQTCYLILV